MPGNISQALRTTIGERFSSYCDTVQSLSDAMVSEGELRYGIQSHWAKLEVKEEGVRSEEAVQKRLRERFPVEEFLAWRKKLAPRNTLSNNASKKWFGF